MPPSARTCRRADVSALAHQDDRGQRHRRSRAPVRVLTSAHVRYHSCSVIRSRARWTPPEELGHPLVSGVLCLVLAVLFLAVSVAGVVRGFWPLFSVAAVWCLLQGVRCLLEAGARRRRRIGHPSVGPPSA